MITLSNKQARQYLLLKQGLLGEHKFFGKRGALEYIKQAGCIQFDPVDLCGKNAELVLQSRVKGFKKKMLHELLYTDRKLFDYPDKQLSIIPIEFWAYFERFRDAARLNLQEHPDIEEYFSFTLEYINKNGHVNSDGLELIGDSSWRSAINWSAGNKLSRSVLEQMYSSGDLVIHHKKGTRRYYDLSQRHIPQDLLTAADPIPDDFAHYKWRVFRRIGAVGLLWNRPSDAWLGIWELTAATRNKVFETLIDNGEITEISVDNLKSKLYVCTSDIHLIKYVLSNPETALKPRCEFIAPLDPFMWDRKLILALFDFAYTWEIYTPAIKRKYGAYVLPIIYGDSFIGRIEAVNERKSKTLIVKNIWYEDGVKQTKKLKTAVDGCVKRFAVFNEVKQIVYQSE